MAEDLTHEKEGLLDTTSMAMPGSSVSTVADLSTEGFTEKLVFQRYWLAGEAGLEEEGSE